MIMNIIMPILLCIFFGTVIYFIAKKPKIETYNGPVPGSNSSTEKPIIDAPIWDYSEADCKVSARIYLEGSKIVADISTDKIEEDSLRIFVHCKSRDEEIGDTYLIVELHPGMEGYYEGVLLGIDAEQYSEINIDQSFVKGEIVHTYQGKKSYVINPA